MILEERIKKLKEKSEPKSGYVDDWHFGYRECIEDFEPIIQEFKEELENCKYEIEYQKTMRKLDNREI